MLYSLDDLIQKARQKNQIKRVAIAAAEDIFVLKAIEQLRKLGLIAPIFIGDKNKIVELIRKNEFMFSETDIIDCREDKETAALAVKLVHEGNADLLMKGLISTRLILKAVLHKTHGIASSQVLSHLALVESPYKDEVFGVTDAAINIAPSLDSKILIIKNSVNAFHSLGYEKPKVALLAAIEKINPKMKDTLEAAKICKLHKEKTIGKCYIEGPLALDVAISLKAANHKGINGEVAGKADLLIVPEITSGNVLYKSLTYLGGAKTAGIVLGAKAPVILTSRADSHENKLYSIALAINLCN